MIAGCARRRYYMVQKKFCLFYHNTLLTHFFKFLSSFNDFSHAIIKSFSNDYWKHRNIIILYVASMKKKTIKNGESTGFGIVQNPSTLLRHREEDPYLEAHQ